MIRTGFFVRPSSSQCCKIDYLITMNWLVKAFEYYTGTSSQRQLSTCGLKSKDHLGYACKLL